MKKLAAILFLFISGFAYSQYDMEEAEKEDEDKERKITPFELKERTYVGGELSVRFGTTTYLYIAPFVGYDVYKNVSVGVSTMYQLFRIKYTNGAVLSSNSYGGGMFTRYRPIKPLLVQMEFDIYNTEDFSSLYGDRINVPVFMGGLGYAGSMGEKAYYQFLLMYDFIDDDNMPLIPLIIDIPVYLRYGFVFYLG